MHSLTDHILIEDVIQVFFVSSLLLGAICKTCKYVVVAEVTQKLLFSKGAAHSLDMERFNFTKLNYVEV